MQQEEFLDHAHRIIDAAEQRGATLRLLGAVAFFMHCPEYGFFQERANRAFTDLDFAAYFKHSPAIRGVFEKMGYQEDREVAVVYARQRLVFNDSNSGLHLDVFFDKLDFCHPIQWAGRLEVDSPTIPLAELLMEKMQIFKLNEKDVIDTLMLLREHPLGNDYLEKINAQHIARMCARDWGLWRTSTGNLEKVSALSQDYSWLPEADRVVIQDRIAQLLAAIDKVPKPPSWKARNLIGDRVQWYKDVSEVMQ